MTTRPTTKPALRRDGPDAYVATVDPWPGKPKAPRLTHRIERDGDEWVELGRHYSGRDEPRAWYPTLAAFRRRVADTNVARWVNGHVSERAGDGEKDPAEVARARAFLAWARRAVPGPRCEGTRRDLGGGMVFASHDGCCDPLIRKPIPDGVTLVDLYERWNAS